MPAVVNDWGKFVVLLAVVASSTLLAMAGIVGGEAVLGILLLVVGYVTGNGVLALTKRAPSPVLVPREVGPEHVASIITKIRPDQLRDIAATLEGTSTESSTRGEG